MPARILFCIIALSLLPAAALRAQDSTVAAVRQQIAQMRDTAELRRWEREHETSRTAAHDVAAGFGALQLWEITRDRAHAERARRHFDRAAERDPRNAWAHYGHALTLVPEINDAAGTLALDDVMMRATGMDPRSRARRALERAVSLDPTLPGAAELLTRYAVETRAGHGLQLARAALDIDARHPNASVDVLLGLARTAREQGDYRASAAAAERAAARGGADFAAAHYEAARSLASVAAEARNAGSAYFTALDHADDALLARMWDDIDVIADTADRERWQQAVSVEERRARLRNFWEIHSALGGTTPHARVAEHYARLNVAWQRYRRWGTFGAAPMNALRWEKIDSRYTDPGIIYIRHGEPDHIFSQASASDLSTGFIWYYADERRGPRSYHFRVYNTAGWTKDAVLVHRVNCLAPEAALYDPRLRPLTYGCNGMRVEAISATLRADSERALRTVSDAPRFAHAVPFHFDLYTFRGDGGETEVAVGIGVPLRNLADPDADLVLSLAVVDTARSAAERVSVTAPPQPRSDDRGAMLRALLALRTPPVAAAAYRVAVQDADQSMGKVYGGTLNVPDYSGTSLMISDIVLAEPDREGNFVRRGHRLSLMPSQVFPGGRFRAYYELYNVPPAAAYRTRITISSQRGLAARILGLGESVRLQYDDVAPAAGAVVLSEVREVTAPLSPGDYLLRIEVIVQDGSTFERERRFSIPKQ